MGQQIGASEISLYILSLENENNVLKSIRERAIDSVKFYNVALTTEEVARFHDVSPAVVRKYVALGYIEQHPDSSHAKILIRASDALILDFKNMKKCSRLTPPYQR